MISERSPLVVTAAIACLLAAATCLRPPAQPRPIEHAATRRPSRHAAPPEDVATLNTAGLKRVPESLASAMLPDDRPAVVLFLKADCGCSEEFARLFSAIAPHLAPRASCLAVIEADASDARPFLEATGLATPHLIQSGGGVAAAWGVTKAGCVALVHTDGTVEAIWPGLSRQGFRDLAGRLGDPNLLPSDVLVSLPGAATAGCPLASTVIVPARGVPR